MLSVVVAAVVIIISFLLQYCFSFFKILFKRPLSPRGAVEIDSTQHIYAHPDYTKGLKDPNDFDVKTIYDVLQRSSQQNLNQPHFSYRNSPNQPFQSYTYKEVKEITREIGSGIIYTGLKPSNQTYIGIYSSASINYALWLFSTWPYSMVPIGIYDSLGRDGVKFIIHHAEVELVFADDLQRVQNLLEWKEETSVLKTVVSLIEPTEDLMKLAKDKGLTLMTTDRLRENGRNHPVDPVPPKPSDTAVIMYTSGSTGEPKGCVITHEKFICGIFGVLMAINLFDLLKEKQKPRFLNYLPLAHMFGCGCVVAFTYFGGEIGFWQGKVDKLPDDFRDFKPTLLPMVPRLLNRVYDKVRLELTKKGIPGRILFRLAIMSKLALIRRGDYSQDTIWDKLIFDKVRQSFGGQVNRVVSTSAPLSVEVSRFSRAAFSCFFGECYGQTECVVGCSQTQGDTTPSETGIPTPLNHIKLVDVPEKDYFAKDGVGEICIRSPAVFQGYLKDEEKTREAIDSDGWLHTGDIGRWTKHNTMTIVDRKKNLYKLSQGEYIAPEKIENVYARSRFVSQVFVYGDSLESTLVAIVLLEDDHVQKWAESSGLSMADAKTAEFQEKLRKAVLDDMIREGKRRGLMSYEQVKAIDFFQEPFTIENGLMTPTFKARRYAVEKKYKTMLQNIYKTVKN